MKILVLNINQNTVSRGAEIFWKNLSLNLKQKGVEMEILSNGRPVVQNKSSGMFRKILRRLYLDEYSLAVLFFTLLNLKKIINFRPDILIPSNGGWQAIFSRILRGIFKYKIVIAGQSGIGHDDKFNLRFGNADLFVALTKEQEAWARNINPKIKVEYIPNGVDTNLFQPEGEKNDYQLEKPIFLTVASLEKYKNIESTINAVSDFGKGSLVILGSGEEEGDLKTLCEEKLKRRYFLGRINHQDLPKYYRGADVFTLISGHQEAFGNVYIEAMASGLPVVATHDGKRHEIIGNAGIFVDPANIEEYKTALMKASILNWGDKPHHQAEKFSWEKIGEKYYQLFKNLDEKR